MIGAGDSMSMGGGPGGFPHKFDPDRKDVCRVCRQPQNTPAHKEAFERDIRLASSLQKGPHNGI